MELRLSPRMIEWLSEFHIEGGVYVQYLPPRYEKALARRELIALDQDSGYFRLTPTGEKLVNELFDEEEIRCADCNCVIKDGEGYRIGKLMYCESCN